MSKSGCSPKSIETFIREDISLPRNPILAKLFRSVRLAENAGTGFTKMIRGWKIYKDQSPVFHQEIDYTVVTFWLLPEVVNPLNEGGVTSDLTGGATDGATGGVTEGVKTVRKTSAKTSVKTSVKTSAKTGVKSSTKTSVKVPLTRRQRELVVLLIKDNSRSFAEIAELWGVQVSTVQEHFEKLKNKKAIRHMGPSSGGFWEVLINIG
ncbi:MAG: hypothetical protein IPH84_17985 [Bacteroidales bacterium]|nr:hypothetical protein [Bacteroidales bacterium]